MPDTAHDPVRRAITAVLAGSLLGGVPALKAAATTRTDTEIDTATEWFDVTAATLAAAAAPTQVTNNRTWAIGWLAAARALHGIPATTRRADYADAALASALHEALVTLVPSRTAELDASLAATLERIPAGQSKDLGSAAGRRQARAVLGWRDGDGLDPASVNAPFTVPPAAPGVWQPTPPAFGPAAQYGNRSARPFLLHSADQFRPGPPPALGSRRYAADLAEVRRDGAVDSTTRTAVQTETATFWYGSSYTLYTQPLRVALTRSRHSLAGRALLVATFHTALVDTQIATSDTKYAYTRWRPVTALRADGLPDWTPLHVTPSHPDYVSGHGTYAGAAEQVLTALTGPSTEPFALSSPTAPGVTRTYTRWSQLSADNVDARVWSGIHTRTADEAGVALGKQVAANTLRRIDRLLR